MPPSTRRRRRECPPGPSSLPELLGLLDDVRYLLGEKMDSVETIVRAIRTSKEPLVRLDRDSFNRMMWSTTTPQQAHAFGSHFPHPHPIKSAWESGSTLFSERYCDTAAQSGETELLAWAVCNGCPWSDGVRDAVSTLSVPHGVKRIGARAFARSRSLVGVALPASVVAIQREAFLECTGLKRLELSAGVGYIGARAFCSCSSLEEVRMPPDSPARFQIDEAAFRWCVSLQSIRLPDTLSYLGRQAFQESGLLRIDLPDRLTHLGDKAFCQCTRLRTASVRGVSRVPPGTFNQCEDLTGVELHDGITRIERDAFASCTNLQSIRLPAHLAAIGPTAFTECYALQEVTSGERAPEPPAPAPAPRAPPRAPPWNDEEGIGRYAFACCTQLKRVRLPPGVSGIGYMAFQDCLQLAEVAARVSTVANFAFYECHALKRADLPHLKSIGMQAFAYCGFETLHLPVGLADIDESAFFRCGSLQSVSLPDGLANVGHSAFAQCVQLKEVLVHGHGAPRAGPATPELLGVLCFDQCERLERVHLPRGLTRLGYNMFRNCIVLEEVHLPRDAVYGLNMFEGCARLTRVHIGGVPEAADPHSLAWIVLVLMHNAAHAVRSLGDG